ncbi:VanZ family protein [Agromyces sp. MMS24-K17]|uniref:VanZ family protein n=1 Tax=Agromyces sp. MMS24-K17 TaxID=3372850 RepID=UPI003754CD21
MALVAFWPVPVDSAGRDHIWAFLHWARQRGMPAFVTYAVVEQAANLLWFIPIGALLALELPRRRWVLAPLIAAGMSMFIELVQAVFLVARVSSVMDVLMNTVGAVLGAGIVAAVRASGGRRRGSPTGAAAPRSSSAAPRG